MVMEICAFIEDESSESLSCRNPDPSQRPPIQHPVLQRLGHVGGLYVVAVGEVGDGARDAQNARVGTRRQPEAVDAGLEEAATGRVESAVALELGGSHGGVGGAGRIAQALALSPPSRTTGRPR